MAIPTDLSGAARDRDPGAATERYRAMVEAAPFGLHFYRLEPDGRLVFTGANPAADRILRVENGAFVGQTIEEAFPALAATEVPERYRAVAREGQPWYAEQVTYDHDRIRGAFVVHAFRIAPGEMAAAFQDVTARKQAELALSQERDRLETTLHSIGDGVVVTDAEGRVTMMNPIAATLTGWPAAAAVGRPLEEVFRIASEDTGAAVESPVRRVLREGVVVGLANHTVLVARDGTRRPIADSGAPVRGSDGSLSGVVLVFRDQSAERAQEQRLVESEARYRALVRSAPVVQWMTDREGRFTLSEGLGLRALGLAPGEVVGRLVEEVYAGHARILEDLQCALAGESRITETRVGAAVFETRWAPIHDEAGAVVGVAGIGVDVTAQRQLQEQVQRAQRLESVGRLAGGVAHDFNNLLTVILSCAEVLREELGAAATGAALEDVEQIRLAGERARDLTRQLLTFARRGVISPEPTDLVAAARRAENLLRRVLGEDVALVVSVEGAPRPVLFDAGQLDQILINLAVNARDAMPGGGHLYIEVRNLHVEASDPVRRGDLPGDWVQLVVRDDGAGMSPEVQAHLFEPFFTTKAPGQGTGLGLATVYGIVSQAGGHLHVESAPGRGTTFEIDLPVSAQAPQRTAPVAAPPPGRGRERVLVVEDDAQVRAVTVRALEDAGYQVLIARDGQEALELAAREPRRIDLVVSDVIMPGLDGHEVVEALTRRIPGLRALYVSGYSQDVIAQRGVIAPGVRLLSKPFTPAALLARVREALDAPSPG